MIRLPGLPVDLAAPDALVLAALSQASDHVTTDHRRRLLDAVLLDEPRVLAAVLENDPDHGQLLATGFFEPWMILAALEGSARTWEAMALWGYSLKTQVDLGGERVVMGELAARLASPERLEDYASAGLFDDLDSRRLSALGMTLGGPEQFDFWRARARASSGGPPGAGDLYALDRIFREYGTGRMATSDGARAERARRLEAVACDWLQGHPPQQALWALAGTRQGRVEGVERWLANWLWDRAPPGAVDADALLAHALPCDRIGVVQTCLERGANPVAWVGAGPGSSLASALVRSVLGPGGPHAASCWGTYWRATQARAPHLLAALPATWRDRDLDAAFTKQALQAGNEHLEIVCNALDLASRLPPPQPAPPAPRL